MSNDDEKLDIAPDEYSIGYKKPPKHTRFQAGKSGNPKGRPKGAKGFSTIFREEANKKVQVKIGDKVEKITKLQAAMAQLVNKAAQGNHAAICKVMDMATFEEQKQEEIRIQEDPETISQSDLAIIESYKKRNDE